MTTWSTSADVIVVGRGAIGLSCALHVAARGLSVLLIERGLAAAETTTATGGGVRLQFERPDNAQRSRFSRPFWPSCAELSGVEAGIREIGNPFLAQSAGAVTDLCAASLPHGRMGVPGEGLGGPAVGDRCTTFVDTQYTVGRCAGHRIG